MNTPAERPWYRQFWVWFVIAIPAIAVVSSLHYVYLAVVNKDEVVSGDWYQDGKSINEDFARVDTSRALGVHARIILDDLTGEALVSLDSSSNRQWPASLTLRLNHTTLAARDQNLLLVATAPGEYRGELKQVPAGRYTLDISTDAWHISKDVTLPAPGTIDLAAQ